MVDAAIPGHVAARRRDGRYEVLLHRSVALIGKERVEIRSARSTVVLPALGVALGGGAGALIAIEAGDLPFGLLVGLLEAFGAGYVSSEYKDAVAFIVILVVLFFFPGGLFGKAKVERV